MQQHARANIFLRGSTAHNVRYGLLVAPPPPAAAIIFNWQAARQCNLGGFPSIMVVGAKGVRVRIRAQVNILK